MNSTCQTGRDVAGRSCPGPQGQTLGGVFQGAPWGLVPEPILFGISMQTRKKRTENMLIKSASGTQFGRVAKIL